MYYSGSLANIITTNTAIIGERETGKTTILKRIIKHCYNENYTILIFDSATDHENKSILIDTLSNYKDSSFITSPKKSEILFSNISLTSFPYKNLITSNKNLYLFDVSKYLEEGYETKDLLKRNEIREYYKQLVVQILTVFLPMLKENKYIIIMDEIEFNNNMRILVEQYNSHNVNFVSCLHKESSLLSSADLFNKLYL